MAKPDNRPVTMEELLVSSLAQTDVLAKLLIDKGNGVSERISKMDDVMLRSEHLIFTQRCILNSMSARPT